MTSGSWPETGNDETKAKAVFDAEIEVETERQKSSFAEDLETAKADEAKLIAANQAKLDNLAEFYGSMSKMATDGIEHARSAADTVQKASAAIATLYTGTLALVFSVTDNPLPARGVLTPAFLGLAVVLSTAYLAYVVPTLRTTDLPVAGDAPEPRVFARIAFLVDRARTIASRRSWCLRASVVALGVGLAYIVLPFVSFATSSPDASTSQLQDWPEQPEGSPALSKILFKAQVDEIAKARAAFHPQVETHDQEVLVAGGIIGLALVLIVPTLTRSSGKAQ